MKNVFLFLCALLANSGKAGTAYIPGPKVVPTANTTICNILERPKLFASKIVTFRGDVQVGLETLTARDGACKKSIWLDYPDDVIRTEGMKDPKVELLKDETFAKFEQAIAAEEDSPDHPCQAIHCMRYEVKATIEGRVNYRSTICRKNRASGVSSSFQCGYGHLGQWPVRVIIERVSDLSIVSRY